MDTSGGLDEEEREAVMLSKDLLVYTEDGVKKKKNHIFTSQAFTSLAFGYFLECVYVLRSTNVN